MPKTLADARTKLTAITTKPDALDGVTAAEAAAGTDIQCQILASDFRLSATGSDSVSEASLCNDSNATAPGRSNYEGRVTVFRYYDENGQVATAEDFAYDLFKEKGATVYLMKRVGPKHDVAWAAGDEYTLWEVVPDEGQDPSDVTGYIKVGYPLFVQNKTDGAVAAA